MGMVVALVALAVRRMEGHVRDHAPVDQLRADPVFDQGVPVGGTQLGGQRHGDFAGDLGILPGLDRLDRGVLDALRQPLETGDVRIDRSSASATRPAWPTCRWWWWATLPLAVTVKRRW